MAESKLTICAGLLLLATLTVSVAGCATHSTGAGSALARLKGGDATSALQWSERLKVSAFSKNLGQLESGRIKMLSGDFAGSRADFEAAIDTVLEETENGPAIRLGSIGSTLVASTVADDAIRNYELSPYEIIQLLHYQTLNYLFSGDPQGAAVEMRRTVFAQDSIAEKYSKEVKAAPSAADQKITDARTQAMEAVNAKLETMGPALERTRSSHENGLAWYFCGVMFEKQGDLANATLCYRKAWELSPQNPDVTQDFLRLLQTQDKLAFMDLVLKNPVDVSSLTRGSTEVIVLYEDSFISQRHAEKIQIPIPDFQGTITLVAIDFPFYSDPAYMPSPLVLNVDACELGSAEPAVYLQSLAYRDLKEKLPGIITRNVTRAVTKIAAQQVANQGNGYAQFGMMALNAVASVASTSDTRAWYSIPMGTQLYRGSISPGARMLECRSPLSGTVLTIPLNVVEGETRLVWIADTGGLAVAATASLTGNGLPPTCQQFNNPFRNNAVPESMNSPATVGSEGETVTSGESKEIIL
jgi:uncharacterized protein